MLIVITHLSTVCELLDLSSCDARNHQTNCHYSKTGQYLIPHDCGEIRVYKHREMIAEDKIYLMFFRKSCKIVVYMGQNVYPSDGHNNNFRYVSNSLPHLKTSAVILQRHIVALSVSLILLKLLQY